LPVAGFPKYPPPPEDSNPQSLHFRALAPVFFEFVEFAADVHYTSFHRPIDCLRHPGCFFFSLQIGTLLPPPSLFFDPFLFVLGAPSTTLVPFLWFLMFGFSLQQKVSLPVTIWAQEQFDSRSFGFSLLSSDAKSYCSVSSFFPCFPNDVLLFGLCSFGCHRLPPFFR